MQPELEFSYKPSDPLINSSRKEKQDVSVFKK